MIATALNGEYNHHILCVKKVDYMRYNPELSPIENYMETLQNSVTAMIIMGFILLIAIIIHNLKTKNDKDKVSVIYILVYGLILVVVAILSVCSSCHY